MRFQQVSGKTRRGGKPFGCQCGCSRRAATLNVYFFIENPWGQFHTSMCVRFAAQERNGVLADATRILASKYPTNMCDDLVKTWLEWPNTVVWRAAVSCMLSLSPSSLRQGKFSRGATETTAAEGRERQGRSLEDSETQAGHVQPTSIRVFERVHTKLDAHHVIAEAVRGTGKENSLSWLSHCVSSSRSGTRKVYTSLGISPATAFTGKFD